MDALCQGLARAAERAPDAQSTSFAPRRRTWRQTIDRVSRVACALATLKVQPGDRVAIFAQNTDRYLELMYAVAWIGAVLVPIDTGLSGPVIAHVLHDSKTVLLFIDGTMAHHLTDPSARLRDVREIVWIDDISSPEGMLHYEDLAACDPLPAEDLGGEHLACLFYDGSTALTKPVMLTQADMVANAHNAVSLYGFDPTTVYLHASPMFELAEDALTFAVTIAGGRHVFVPRFEPGEVLQIAALERVTHAQLGPSMIEQLLSYPRFSEADLSRLHSILHGTRPIPAPLHQRVREKLPHVRLVDGDGHPAS